MSQPARRVRLERYSAFAQTKYTLNATWANVITNFLNLQRNEFTLPVELCLPTTQSGYFASANDRIKFSLRVVRIFQCLLSEVVAHTLKQDDPKCHQVHMYILLKF